jgi:serine/threonine-protein kinase RsbW
MNRRPGPESGPSSHVADARLRRDGIAADAVGVAQARVDLTAWLRQHFALEDERLNDVVLTAYEALANAAEFAYLDTPGLPTVELRADYDSHSDSLTITVSDSGRWRSPSDTSETTAHHPPRGRGIPLMRALADDATIHTNDSGTRVQLGWNNLARPSE